MISTAPNNNYNKWIFIFKQKIFGNILEKNIIINQYTINIQILNNLIPLHILCKYTINSVHA